MREPHFTDVERLPLIGGRLCLDFVNTTGARASRRPRERLGAYALLLAWARRAGVLPRLDEMRLAELARQLPEQAGLALGRAREARELLYRTFLATLTGSPPATSDLVELNGLVAVAARWRVLEPAGSRLAWRVRPPQDLDGILWPVITDAAELLVSEAIGGLKQCGECDWLFLDRTRNGGRRWCKKACGDRVKSRRYYGRRRAADLPSPREPRERR